LSPRKSLCFVATSPFAVNAFLLGHLSALAETYRVSLCVNLDAYPLSEQIDSRISIYAVHIERKISLGKDVRALMQLIGIFRREKFDAVHSITPKGGLLAMCAAFVVRVKHRHHTFTGQVWALRSGLARIFFKKMDWLIASFATRVFSDSVSQSRFLESEGIADRESISVLGKGSISGVDELRFKPNEQARKKLRAERSTSERTCVFLFVGRLVKDKGVFDLLRAFGRLSDSGIDSELWVVGPDEAGLQNELAQMSEASQGRVYWIGSTFEPENFMAAADVLVLPSYREGFGLVIAEAASCGIPAIAYRIDGVIDAVEENRTGLLVKMGDVGEFADAMHCMLINTELRQQYGQQARQRIRCDFSQQAITSAWLSFYDLTMNDSASRP
jgi:glycosyltransferase involved in cell wall biosynthesis